MKNISFVLWMLFYPVTVSLTIYIDMLLLNPDFKIYQSMAIFYIVLYVGVALLLYIDD